jgi:four helix bundle protein
MKIERFEDLWIWKEAMRMTCDVYKLLSNCRDFGLRDQAQRAAVSVPSNIAEGFERQSNKEFIQYLYIAKGSCSELRTQLYLAVELKIIDKESGLKAIRLSQKVSAMIYNFIKSRRENF